MFSTQPSPSPPGVSPQISSSTSRAFHGHSPRSSFIVASPGGAPPALVSPQWLRDVLSITGGDFVHPKTSGAASLNELYVRTVCLLHATWRAEPGFDGYEQHYKRGHIHGAVFLDPQGLYPARQSDDQVSLPIPEPGHFERFVSSMGITKDSHVVIYDSVDSRSAARAWFLFRLFGHDRVSVLDGGLGQWIRDGHEICTAVCDGTACRPDDGRIPSLLSPSSAYAFKAEFRPDMLRNFVEMQDIVEDGETQVIDCRPEPNSSEDRPSDLPTGTLALPSSASSTDIPLAGYIPRAIHIPFTSFFTPEGTFKEEEELLQVFETSKVDLSLPAVVYCQRGMTSSVVILAACLCGTPNLPIYNGAWDEWKTLAPPSLIASNEEIRQSHE